MLFFTSTYIAVGQCNYNKRNVPCDFSGADSFDAILLIGGPSSGFKRKNITDKNRFMKKKYIH